MQRILECALIMGKAEEHQVPKKVRNAVAHGWGGVTNFTVTVLGIHPGGTKMSYLKDERPTTIGVEGNGTWGTTTRSRLLEEHGAGLKEKKLIGSFCPAAPRSLCLPGTCVEDVTARWMGERPLVTRGLLRAS
jgi:hypothetical protein